MTSQEAYRAGFFLKCAQLGIPAGVATSMLDRPQTIKSSVLGAALCMTANAGIGAARGTGKLLGGSQQLGADAASLALEDVADNPYKFDGKLEFSHLSFGYNRDRSILHDINLLIEPYQTVALVGRSGSGKSTYRKKQVNEKNASYTNMDEIRIKLRETSNLSKKEFETEVKKIKFQKLEELFKHDTPYVIVDDTNLSQKTISQAVSLAKKYNYEVKYTFMETSFNVLKCHKNNMQRDHSEHVPLAVIENMAEMFYKLWFTHYTKDVVVNSNRKKAIIVDIDGTASHMTTRGPYDWHRVDEDMPDETIRKLVNFYFS